MDNDDDDDDEVESVWEDIIFPSIHFGNNRLSEGFHSVTDTPCKSRYYLG